MFRSSRRRFLNWMLGVSGASLAASVLFPIVRYMIPPELDEAPTNAVTLPFEGSEVPANSGRIFKFGNEPGILIRTLSRELRAFSAVCTHLACIVQYREDLSHIWCACHNGHYDLQGRNIAGPPPRPLPKYDVTEQGERIVVMRSG